MSFYASFAKVVRIYLPNQAKQRSDLDHKFLVV